METKTREAGARGAPRMTTDEAMSVVLYAARQEQPRWAGDQRTKLDEAIAMLSPPEGGETGATGTAGR